MAAGRERLAVGHGASAAGAALPDGGRRGLVGVLDGAAGCAGLPACRDSERCKQLAYEYFARRVQL